jgi:hypothetical protein
VYIPSEENIQADAASRFQSLPDWHLSKEVFSLISSVRGPPEIDLFASCLSAQTKKFFGWDARDSPEAINALSQKWDFSLAYAFPPIALLKRVMSKRETSRGTFLLVTPFWEAQTWFASLLSLNMVDIHHLPLSSHLVVDLMTGQPPPILDRLSLVVWMITGGVEASPLSLTDPLISSRQGGLPPQRNAMKALGGPLRSSFVLPPFLSIKLLRLTSQII